MNSEIRELTNDQIFVLGYLAGKTQGELTDRQILEEYPSLSLHQVAIFAQGTIDGHARDEYRLTVIRKKEQIKLKKIKFGRHVGR